MEIVRSRLPRDFHMLVLPVPKPGGRAKNGIRRTLHRDKFSVNAYCAIHSLVRGLLIEVEPSP